MYPAASHVAGRILSSRTEGGYIIATLAGDLDIAAAPMLRDKLLVMLDPAASRLIIDLSATRYADASGLAVLISTGRRARLLGGFLRLAAPSPQVTDVLSITGLSRHLATFPTVHAAINSPPRSQRRHDGGTEVRANIGTPSATQAQPAGSHAGMAWRAADHGELRMAGRRPPPPVRSPAACPGPGPFRHQPRRVDPSGTWHPVRAHPAAPDPLPGGGSHREPPAPPPGPISPACPHLSARRRAGIDHPSRAMPGMRRRTPRRRHVSGPGIHATSHPRPVAQSAAARDQASPAVGPASSAPAP